MTSPLHDEIVARIRERGPITVAEFMQLALYDPQHGYYTSRSRRSGRDGDFFTSVDVGPLFGELIAVQLSEMWELLAATGAMQFDLVEAGAGDGRLTRDILDAVAREHPELYAIIRVTLVERSAPAREAQRETLAAHADRIAGSLAELSESSARFTGVLVANELLDALPVHVVTMTGDGPREVLVGEQDGALVEIEGPLSHVALSERLNVNGRLAPGWRKEVSLAADDWIRRAAAALDRGFLLLFDYGYDSQAFDSGIYAKGTLTAYRAHTADAVHWLSNPGSCDLTAHVDLRAIRFAAETAGLRTIGLLDQTYFLIALGLADRLTAGTDIRSVSRRLAAKTLMLPGGLGSTMKTMLFAKNLEVASLRGLTNHRLT